MILDASVDKLSKIGPKTKFLLEKLEVYTVEDLLYYFPFRFDDFTNVKKIAEAKLEDVVTVKATIISADNVFTRNGKRITTAKIQDETGKMDVIWFNQHYIKSSLTLGEEFNFSGKVQDKKLIAPEFEPAYKTMNTGSLVPVYFETAGITSKLIRSKVTEALDRVSGLEEFLPKEILESNEFPQIKEGIKKMHFPKDIEERKVARDRFAYEELFLELLQVENRKYEWQKLFLAPSIDIESHKDPLAKFIDDLPFMLTESQQTSLQQIYKQMTEKHPMNLLLEGDVGSGKTVVAVCAAYLAHLNKYKTLYLAPTEILAEQHFETFKKFLGKNDLNIKLLTGSKKEGLDTYDIIIGTHAILHHKDPFEDVGLVIIDEQHRFGVQQRARLIEMSAKGDQKPHMLTMTATPIPRTLALTLYGDLTIAKIDAVPNKEKKITTKVVSDKERQKVYEWIRNKEEPTFIVCPLIEESESETLENVKSAQKEFKELSEGIFKNIPTGLLHGKMKPVEKSEIIEKFRAGEIKVLISTPVIEVGVDIPEATIMVIESAERYGLASLHQLRGRVGRGKKEAYCFVFMSNFNRKAYERLKYLESVDKGIELAEIDLRLRGEGDIFGTQQHGIKKLRVASYNDISLLEKVKVDAQEYYPKLENFPALKQKLNKINKSVVNN